MLRTLPTIERCHRPDFLSMLERNGDWGNVRLQLCRQPSMSGLGSRADVSLATELCRRQGMH